MRNISKGIDIGKNFPIYAIENDFIISKTADITAAYRVLLPEVFTITDIEYEMMHSTWLKAFKVLPDYCIIHKQDWVTTDKYEVQPSTEEKSFLSRSFDNHFHERPYMNHSCYLFVTKTRKGRHRVESINNILLSGHIVSAEVLDNKALNEFSDAISQMEQIINDSGLIHLERLKADEISGTTTQSGILEKHLCLNQADEKMPLEDIVFNDGDVTVGDKHLCLYTISSSENLPLQVATDMGYEAFSTDVSKCVLSFTAPLGILLNRDHVYNQYIFIDNSDANLRELESKGQKMFSLSLVSSQNAVNESHIKEYVANAMEHKLMSVRAHINVVAWSDNLQELSTIKNEIGSALSSIGCEKVRCNTVDCPVLFWASMPGNEGDFPREEGAAA